MRVPVRLEVSIFWPANYCKTAKLGGSDTCFMVCVRSRKVGSLVLRGFQSPKQCIHLGLGQSLFGSAISALREPELSR